VVASATAHRESRLARSWQVLVIASFVIVGCDERTNPRGGSTHDTVETPPNTTRDERPEPPIVVPPDDAYVLDWRGAESAQSSTLQLRPTPDLRVSTHTNATGGIDRIDVAPAGITMDPGLLGWETFIPHQDRERVRGGGRRENACALVANAAIPLDALAVYIADDELQVRIYLLESSVDEVVRNIRIGAQETLRHLSRDFTFGQRDPPHERGSPRAAFAGWTPVLVRFQIFDNFAFRRANMDFHLRRFGGSTVVVVFTHAEYEVTPGRDEMLSLIESIHIEPPVH
jgi:hypothetical protein